MQRNCVSNLEPGKLPWLVDEVLDEVKQEQDTETRQSISGIGEETETAETVNANQTRVDLVDQLGILISFAQEAGDTEMVKQDKLNAEQEAEATVSSVKREYEKAESLIKENNVVMAYGELFNMESEFWISILAEIEKPILCISAEADWNYNGEEIAQHVQNENVKFKILPDVDATMRLGFRNHLAANNLTYMGYLNRKGVTKPEDGKDIPCYAEDIGKCIMEYMEHLQ